MEAIDLKRNKFIKNNYLDIIFISIILIASIFPFFINSSHYDFNGAYNFRDIDIPFNLFEKLKDNLFAWNSNSGLGYPNFSNIAILTYHIPIAILIKIGLPIILSQKIYISIIFFLLGYSAFRFFTFFFKIESKINLYFSSTMGALFYMYNIVIYQKFIGVPQVLISSSIFLLILINSVKLIYIKGIFNEIKYAFYISILLTLMLASDFTMFFLYLIAIIFFCIIYLIQNRKSFNYKLIIRNLSLIILVTILLNTWWLSYLLYDLIKSKIIVSGFVANPYNDTTFEMVKNLSNSPLDILRLQWTKNSFYFQTSSGPLYPSQISQFYNSPFSYFAFIPLLFFAFYLSLKEIKNNKILTFLMITGLIGLLFSLGDKSPFNFWFVHEFLHDHFPGFTLLRNFLKFQFLVIPWYSALIVILSNFLLRKINVKKVFSYVLTFIIIFTFIIVNSLPFFYKDLSGRLEFYEIPNYYSQVREFVESDNSLFRLLVFPQPAWEETYEWGPKFELVPVFYSYFNIPILYQNPIDATGAKEFVEPINKLKINNLNNYLNLLNVKYVLLRNDIRESVISKNNKQILNELPSYLVQKDYKLIKSFENKLLIYQSKNDVNFLPYIYIPHNIIFTNGGIKDLSDIVSQENYKKYSSIFFINRKSLKDDLSKNIFKETFSQKEFFLFADKANNYKTENFEELQEISFQIEIPIYDKYTVLIKGVDIKDIKSLEIDGRNIFLNNNLDNGKTKISESWNELAQVQLKNNKHEIKICTNVQFKPIIALSNLKKESHNQKNILPEITFVKINPTKYKILIKDYKKPFYIIFSETFNNGWKLYLKNNLKNNDYEIFKNTSINSKDFFDYPSFFETSKLKKIPETQHLFANGYANAWFIATESFETNSDYEIILEYEPQKLLYLGLTITLITIIFTISFFIIYLIKKHSDIIRYNSK